MTDQHQPTSKEHSLDIIHRMIARAKGAIKNSSFYFLMWGWVIVAGSIGHYLLLQFSTLNHPELAWTVILVGIIGSIIQGNKDRTNHGASTYPNRLYTTVWVIFLINYFIILVFIAKINFYITPLVLILAAGSTYLSGTIIRFKPLKWGAIFIWLMGIISFLVPLPYQLLATTTAVLIGYLIPGYMLKQKEA